MLLPLVLTLRGSDYVVLCAIHFPLTPNGSRECILPVLAFKLQMSVVLLMFNTQEHPTFYRVANYLVH